MEQLLVSYAGPGALDECRALVMLLEDAENGPQRKEKKSQISSGIRHPLVHVAFQLLTKAHGKEIMDYGTRQCGDFFQWSETQFEGWCCEKRKRSNDPGVGASIYVHNPEWRALLPYRV